MERAAALWAFVALVMLAACDQSSGPLVPPLGTRVPVETAEDALPPGRMLIPRMSRACNMPAPSAEAQVLAIIAGRGNAVSNIAVTGVDNETTAATIFIEAGEAPVYLFALNGSAMVWNVTGATERVERLVIQPPSEREGPGVGVAGLPSKKVSALTADACGGAYSYTQGEAMAQLEKLRSVLRRPDLLVIGLDSLGTANAPSGTPGPGNRAGAGPMIEGGGGTYVIQDGKPKRINKRGRNFPDRQFKRFYPAGVVMLDPGAVVSTRPVAVYDVLPGQAGLLQLLGAGLITFRPDGAYLIEGSIPGIPTGLAGAHRVDFVLKDGAPKPKGNIGHSSLFDEMTGTCLDGLCKSLEDMSKMR
ncbi:hypothetical protein [Hyphomonas johnsonii]|nr:hypothetical protein [Hyphomonas johnsonii]